MVTLWVGSQPGKGFKGLYQAADQYLCVLKKQIRANTFFMHLLVISCQSWVEPAASIEAVDRLCIDYAMYTVIPFLLL